MGRATRTANCDGAGGKYERDPFHEHGLKETLRETSSAKGHRSSWGPAPSSQDDQKAEETPARPQMWTARLRGYVATPSSGPGSGGPVPAASSIAANLP